MGLSTGESSAFCWAVSLDRKQCELELYPFKKYSSFTFLDPQRCLFGITIGSDHAQHSDPQLSVPKTSEKHSLTHSLMFETPAKQNNRINSASKREASEERDEAFERLKKIRQMREAKEKEREADSQFLRTERVKTESLWSASPKMALNSTSGKRHAISGVVTSREKDQSRSNSRENNFSGHFRKPVAHTIQSISQYARSSYGHKPSIDRARQSMSFQMEHSGKKEEREKSGEHSFNHHENFYKRVQ